MTLRTKGADRTGELCAEYDLYPEDYLSGDRRFPRFDKAVYGSDEVKNLLLRAQHGKCCYCESRFTSTTFGDIEHYRPKGPVRQDQGAAEERPGYYWLAYDWDNLLVSCEVCNRRFKRSLFPLASPEGRARSHHDGIANERCLLINPGLEDPRDHIRFRNDAPMPLTEVGRVTIKTIGLRRPELSERRQERIALVKTFQRILDLARSSSDQRLSDLEDEASDHLNSAARPGAEFSSMVHDYLRLHA